MEVAQLGPVSRGFDVVLWLRTTWGLLPVMVAKDVKASHGVPKIVTPSIFRRHADGWGSGKTRGAVPAREGILSGRHIVLGSAGGEYGASSAWPQAEEAPNTVGNQSNERSD